MSDANRATAPGGGMSRGLSVLFAIAGGAAVGNLYWAQPLLIDIGHDLGVAEGTAGTLVTATQLGYAVGVLLLVPLGDVLDRRRLVPAAFVLVAVMLALAAAAPSFPLLLVALALVGIVTVPGQILAPLAGDLSDDASRGRNVGTVVSGILIGILLSRTLSGFIAGAVGWRVIYLVAAVAAVVLAVALRRAIPSLPPRDRIRYAALIGSVFALVRRERAVRFSLLLGGTAFGLFTLFWTALTFLLAAPPFRFPVEVIGLFGLVGLAGAIAAQRAGRLQDRGFGLPGIGVAWVLGLAAFVVAGLGIRSVPLIVVAIVLLDVAVQGQNILVQSRLFGLDPTARSRLNTTFVTNNFLWGAVGSLLATVLWAAFGWAGISVAGCVGAGFALTVWLVGRRGPLRIGEDQDMGETDATGRSAEERAGFFTRLRRTLLRGDATGAGGPAGPTAAGRGLWAVRDPGPFDTPPAEPVELDADQLPWELRDEDADRS